MWLAGLLRMMLLLMLLMILLILLWLDEMRSLAEPGRAKRKCAAARASMHAQIFKRTVPFTIRASK